MRFIDEGIESSERISNQIIRFELEETGDNTNTFEGSVKYAMLNQLNILNPSTYTNLSTIADDPTFIVIDILTGNNSPKIIYKDKDIVGNFVQISDQQETPTHTGSLYFDSNFYNPNDIATITMTDMDLNFNSDLFDIFTVVDGSLFEDPARDTVGKPALPTFSFGPLGKLFEVTIDGVRWQQSETCIPDNAANPGLFSSGFAFVETTSDSGVFMGAFQVPDNFCRESENDPETTAGLHLGGKYFDFRNNVGQFSTIFSSSPILSCQVPLTGNWTITNSCVLTEDAQSDGSVFVQNNSLFTIANGVTMTIPPGENITIKSGSGVLIKVNGTLQILS